MDIKIASINNYCNDRMFMKHFVYSLLLTYTIIIFTQLLTKLLHQFSLSMFSLLLEYFFLSGKYSHLIDLFFHVVYFLLENDILWNLLYFKYIFVKVLLLMMFISISLKTSNILEKKSQVFERSDCIITVHNYLYYSELKM